MFNKWQAQRWWGENYDRIMELYNVHRFSRNALPTPLRSDYEVRLVSDSVARTYSLSLSGSMGEKARPRMDSSVLSCPHHSYPGGNHRSTDNPANPPANSNPHSRRLGV